MFFLTLALLLAAAAATDQNWWLDAKGFTVHSAEELDDLIAKNPKAHILVDFYMQQCYWCQKFMPEWNRLFEQLSSENLIFVKVDGPKNPYLAQEFGVSSYPSFVLVHGTQYSQFSGERTFANMKAWLDKYLPPAAEGQLAPPR